MGQRSRSSLTLHPSPSPDAGIAGLLTFVMGKKFLVAYKVMPAGVVAGLSACMVLYYIYNMLAGGNPKRKTDKKAE